MAYLIRIARLFVAATCSIMLLAAICLAQDPAEPDTIVVYGDSRTNHDAHQEVVSAISKHRPVAVFHVGDMVDHGSDLGEWQQFDAILSTLPADTEFYPVIGNHDSDLGILSRKFPRIFGNTQWYYIDKDRLRFIILNSNAPLGPASPQYRWLEMSLQDAAQKGLFVIPILHHPVFTSSSYGNPVQPLASILPQLFRHYGIRLVFSGDAHNYERSYTQGTYYIVTGGGGAPLKSMINANPYSQVFKKTYHFCTLQVTAQGLIVIARAPSDEILDTVSIPWAYPAETPLKIPGQTGQNR